MKPYYSVKRTKFRMNFQFSLVIKDFSFFLHFVHSTVSSFSHELSFGCILKLIRSVQQQQQHDETNDGEKPNKISSCTPGIPQQTIFKTDLFIAQTEDAQKRNFDIIEHRVLFHLKCCFSHTFFSSSLVGMFKIGNDITTQRFNENISSSFCFFFTKRKSRTTTGEQEKSCGVEHFSCRLQR